MRGMPLFIAAALVVAAGVAALVFVTASGPAEDELAMTGARPAAERDAVSTAGWTDERLRAATPVLPRKLTDEEYQRLIGSRKTPE